MLIRPFSVPEQRNMCMRCPCSKCTIRMYGPTEIGYCFFLLLFDDSVNYYNLISLARMVQAIIIIFVRLCVGVCLVPSQFIRGYLNCSFCSLLKFRKSVFMEFVVVGSSYQLRGKCLHNNMTHTICEFRKSLKTCYWHSASIRGSKYIRFMEMAKRNLAFQRTANRKINSHSYKWRCCRAVRLVHDLPLFIISLKSISC